MKISWYIPNEGILYGENYIDYILVNQKFLEIKMKFTWNKLECTYIN